MRGKAHRVLSNPSKTARPTGLTMKPMGRIIGTLMLLCLLLLGTGWWGFFTTYAQGWFVLTAVGFLGLFGLAAAFTWWVLWQVLRQLVGQDKTIAVLLILALGPVGALVTYLRLRSMDASSRM